jgi:EAL domain-containing protein (putative c-di-GMP-specific phosphodiesterase class I)
LGFQADQPEFVDRVIELAALTGMRMRNLQFELSEKQPLGQTGIENLIRLHQELGIRLVLDNFGRGHSNILLLRLIPFKIVQLSKEFICDINHMDHEFRIAVAIQQFAQVLDLTVCAKGVETAEQLELADEVGFKMAQGYLIGRPMPMEELKSFIMTYRLPRLERPSQPKAAPVSFKMV